MYAQPGMMMGSLADENNGSIQWRESMADDMYKAHKSPSKHIQIRNGGTRKVTNACSTAVNIQSNRKSRERHGDTGTQTKTENQRQRETETNKDRQTCRDRNRSRDTDRDTDKYN